MAFARAALGVVCAVRSWGLLGTLCTLRVSSGGARGEGQEGGGGGEEGGGQEGEVRPAGEGGARRGSEAGRTGREHRRKRGQNINF